MKVLVSTSGPLSREKVVELTARLEEFLVQLNPGVLVLPAGVSVHLLPMSSPSPLPAPSSVVRKTHKEQQP